MSEEQIARIAKALDMCVECKGSLYTGSPGIGPKHYHTCPHWVPAASDPCIGCGRSPQTVAETGHHPECKMPEGKANDW
jgi:hypothetical protein